MLSKEFRNTIFYIKNHIPSSDLSTNLLIERLLVFGYCWKNALDNGKALMFNIQKREKSIANL